MRTASRRRAPAASFHALIEEIIAVTIERYGTGGGVGQGGQHMPFARAAGANGWLFVSGQVPMENGELVEGGIITQTHKAIGNLLAILAEAGYGPEHVV